MLPTIAQPPMKNQHDPCDQLEEREWKKSGETNGRINQIQEIIMSLMLVNHAGFSSGYMNLHGYYLSYLAV